MAAVALRREIDAYGDIIDQYNREGKKYTRQAETHNAAVDAYNASLYKDGSGELVPFVRQGRGGPGAYDPRGTGIVIRGREEMDKYNLIEAGRDGYGNPYYIAQRKDASGNAPSNPGQFTAVAPTKPDEGPSATIGQVKRMNDLGLADYERGNVGLLAGARNG
jgi:hypothetical protein